MILSFSRGFAFVAVPRTGTHSLRERLRPLLSSNDWEQAIRYERRLFPVAALAEIGHGHIRAAEVQPFLIPGMWERMFSFGFVREPFDRFVSCYFFLNRDRGVPDDPLPAMKAMLTPESRAAHILLAPQHSFLCDAEGHELVDFIGRYERFDADVGAICARIGAPAEPARPVNASPRPARFEGDAELRAMIAQIYADDYRLFGYPTP